MFSFGTVSVVLTLYLSEAGLNDKEIGLLLTIVLVSDTGLSLWVSTVADRVGRRKTMFLLALAKVLCSITLAISQHLMTLTAATALAFAGPSGSRVTAPNAMLSPNSNDVDPFASIERAALTEAVPDTERNRAMAWLNFVGALSITLGAFSSGVLAEAIEATGLSAAASYRGLILLYMAVAVALVLLTTQLSDDIEPLPLTAPSIPASRKTTQLGLHRSWGAVVHLSALSMLDAFAGSFILQTVVTYWFQVRYGSTPGALPVVFFLGNVLAACAAIVVPHLALALGLVNALVLAHLPSSIMIVVVPLMPSPGASLGVLFVRYAISQLDAPLRFSYPLGIVDDDERCAAAGVTTIARVIGSSTSPVLAAILLQNGVYVDVPFYIAGSVKVVHDVLLWRSFRALPPPEEAHLGHHPLDPFSPSPRPPHSPNTPPPDTPNTANSNLPQSVPAPSPLPASSSPDMTVYYAAPRPPDSSPSPSPRT